MESSWKKYKLSDIAHVIMGQSPKSSSYNKSGEGIPFFQGKADFNNGDVRVRMWTSEPNKISEAGDILMSVRAPVGDIARNPVRACVGRGLAAIRGKDGTDQDFLYHALNSLYKTINQQAQGSTFKAISGPALREIQVDTPPIKIQKKIAEILSSVDDDIQATQKVIDQTERVKKGLMQDLFTKGIGHTKFKDSELGKIPESWKVVNLKSVCDLGSGGTPKKSNSEFWGGDIPWVSPKDMRKSLINDSIDKITEAGLAQIGVAQPNDLLIVVRSGILIHSLPIAVVGTTLGFNQDLKRLRAKGPVDAKFLYYYLKSRESVILSRGVKRGNTVHSVVTAFLEELPVPLPSPQEQEKISEVFSKLDAKIMTYSDKRQHLDVLKKGLMQDLLSGKVEIST